jgi:hypothetical protein
MWSNPFQTLQLQVPQAYYEDVRRFSQTRPEGGPKPSVDQSPFPRYVDVWFLAFCLGARKGKEVDVESPHDFIPGSIFASDPYRAELIEIVIIAHTGDPFVIAEPANVMRIANRLAAAGLPDVVAMLRDGNAEPIWNLSDALERTLSS